MTAGRCGNSGPSPWASACCSARRSISARSSCGWAYVIWMLVSRGVDGWRETTAGGEGEGRVRLSALRSPLGSPSLGRLLAAGIAGHMKACSSRERSRGCIPLAVPAVRGTTRSKRPSGAACALGRLRVIGATAAAAGGGSARACRLYGATAPPSYRTMVPDIVLLNVCVCEGRVNEFPRESLPKLFSYAVAALSTLTTLTAARARGCSAV